MSGWKAALAVTGAALALAGCEPAQGGAQTSTKATRSAPKPAAPLAAGPFGIAMNTPIEKLHRDSRNDSTSPGEYSLTDVPAPHPDLIAYVVMAFPETGVCGIRGVSASLDNDPHGSGIRSRVDALHDQLSVKYGAGKKSDFCVDKYCSDQFWSQELSGKGRFYSYSWKSTPENPLPNHVKAIELMAGADEDFDPFMIIDYMFDNFDQCLTLQKKSAAAGL